ncbi:MAG: beta-ketothiolase BktB [Candidatus Puniceispirillaceae bacterium]
MNEVYIFSAKRSAIGTFGGTLSQTPARDLLTTIMKSAISKSAIDPERLTSSILGNVVHTASEDPYLSRACAIDSGLPDSSVAFAVNRLCGSGLQAIIQTAMAIKMNDIQAGIASGVEMMSRAPHIAPQLRFGQKMGDASFIDMLLAPLTDPFGHGHMGITAENVAEKYAISRDMQDAFAVTSHERATLAIEKGYFKSQIEPIEAVSGRKTVIFDTDEHVRSDVTVEKMGQLRAVFKKDGLVTAGNSSGINDGAAALVLGNEEIAKSAKPIARIVSYGHAGLDPSIMGMGPVAASQQALERAGISVNDLNVVESNEAFAAQACAVTKELGLDPKTVNPNGGAIALGHPVGATGTIIATKLIHELHRTNGKYGLATMCIGGGQGVALIVEAI